MTPWQLLTHLFDNCIQGAININELEENLNQEWETADHLSKYMRKMKDAQKKIAKAGVDISESQLVLKMVKQMYQSRNFDETDMMKWEKKPNSDKTHA